MRTLAAMLILSAAGWAQFRSTARLVVAPVTVTDSKGRFVDGLNTEDLILEDNSVRQAIQMDWMTYPIDLVVAVQTSANSGPVIDKLGGAGILFSQLLAGNGGETAVLSFSDTVKLHQDFTADPDAVTHALRKLLMEGSNAHMLDALQEALVRLEKQPAGRRRIVLMIAEKRDRGSTAKLAEVMAQAQEMNAAIYWITYSPFLQPFTVKNKVAEDLKPEADRLPWPYRDETPVPYDPGPGGYLYALGELARLRLPDLSALFAETSGGRAMSFLKKDALEQAVQLISQEVHRQYILTFQPGDGEAGAFHAIRVTVKNRPELRVTARTGYFEVR